MVVVVLIVLTAHVLLLALAYRRGRERQAALQWLAATIGLAFVAVATFLLPEDALLAGKLGRGLALTLALIATLAAFGGLVITDMAGTARARLMQTWLAVNAGWLAGTVITALLSTSVAIGQRDWLEVELASPGATTLFAALGLIVTSPLLLGIGFYHFYKAPMPEIANRALYWTANTAALLLAVVMLDSGIDLLIWLGMFTLLASMIQATYAFLSYRTPDIRSAVSLVARTLAVILATAFVIFLALVGANRMQLPPSLQTTLALAALALVVAAFYVPARQIGAAVLHRALAGRMIDPTAATRLYSLRVSEAIDLNALVETATNTVMTALGVRRAGLLLVSRTAGPDEAVELSAIEGGSFMGMKGVRGYLPTTGSVYQALAAKHQPILQFDLEFSPRHQDMTPAERQFFRSLQMSAYTPIVVEKAFIGVLACGSKRNDSPFTQRDLQLLATLAQQTGVALRNARLIADLRHLNTSMNALNKGLERAKEELQKLDLVKTDFVTIASHELRTPLAQIRGYTDIIDALNEQGMLDDDQLKVHIANLRKATERIEELISAMLDVSQLDINAMDLRFAPTTAEAVMRLAIEPLTDAIKQRRQTLSARGLRGLPAIHADLQRLVQAFRNVIVNAIKFTPDGGHIEISASLEEAKEQDQTDHILIAITDSGVGIAQEHLSLIFNKFYRTYDPSLHSTGTYKFLGAGPGLGLTIAKGVIEGHGGKIWAESPGHDMDRCPGTTFFVRLPVSPPESARRVLTFEGDGKAAPRSAKSESDTAKIARMKP